jgi:hypothetical protein
MYTARATLATKKKKKANRISPKQTRAQPKGVRRNDESVWAKIFPSRKEEEEEV